MQCIRHCITLIRFLLTWSNLCPSVLSQNLWVRADAGMWSVWGRRSANTGTSSPRFIPELFTVIHRHFSEFLLWVLYRNITKVSTNIYFVIAFLRSNLYYARATNDRSKIYIYARDLWKGYLDFTHIIWFSTWAEFYSLFSSVLIIFLLRRW